MIIGMGASSGVRVDQPARSRTSGGARRPAPPPSTGPERATFEASHRRWAAPIAVLPLLDRLHRRHSFVGRRRFPRRGQLRNRTQREDRPRLASGDRSYTTPGDVTRPDHETRVIASALRISAWDPLAPRGVERIRDAGRRVSGSIDPVGSRTNIGRAALSCRLGNREEAGVGHHIGCVLSGTSKRRALTCA